MVPCDLIIISEGGGQQLQSESLSVGYPITDVNLNSNCVLFHQIVNVCETDTEILDRYML